MLGGAVAIRAFVTFVSVVLVPASARSHAVLMPGAGEADQDTHGLVAPMVRVHVLDRAAIAPRDWISAERVAATIYQKAGVGMVWDHDGIETASADRPVDATIIVITGRASQTSATSFGVASDALAFVPGTADNHGSLVYVFDDRVSSLSSHSGIPYSALLGRVLAHEIGHVLLPFNSHSPTGIMRESVDATSQHLEFFTDAQAAVIRERLMNGSKRRDGLLRRPIRPLIGSVSNLLKRRGGR